MSHGSRIELPTVMVACQKALALVDLQRGRTRVLHEGAGSYYGITWDKEYVYVVARGYAPGRLIRFDVNMVEETPPDLELGAPDGDADGPHQIHYNRDDGQLYVTDTERNAIVRYDPKAGVRLSVEWQRGGCEHLHVNSIWSNYQGLWIVEHRGDTLPKVVRCLTADGMRRADFYLNLPELAGGDLHRGLHNVYVERAVIHTLGPTQMITLDMLSLKSECYAIDGVERDEHYLRGLARHGDMWLPGLSKWFVGCSQAGSRPGRGYGVSAVLVLDERFKLLYRVELPVAWGQINEIRTLGKDGSHNMLDCPLERVYA